MAAIHLVAVQRQLGAALCCCGLDVGFTALAFDPLRASHFFALTQNHETNPGVCLCSSPAETQTLNRSGNYVEREGCERSFNS
jgi:hypothetical protein